MKELFSLDRHDYDPSWPVFTRNSARGIIARDGKILLVYSQKYKYYKFPGGGIHENEDPKDALIREVLEETGYRVIPETIREYGIVPRRQKDAWTDGIFAQDNLYYLCDVSDEVEPQQLDDYERDEGFTAVWIEPLAANSFNRHQTYSDGNQVMIKRDSKIMDMIDLHLRREKQKADELAWKQSLGEPYFADMIDFVGNYLGGASGWVESKLSISYSRFEHSKRVTGWALRLYNLNPNRNNIDYNTVITAAIFHDVGYNDATDELPHAEAGAVIARKYLKDNGFEPEFIDRVCYLIAHHSDKQMMAEPEIDADLLILMEADLLDDMGALGIAMDCMIERAWNDHATFGDVLNHIGRYTLRRQRNNPMRTAEGRALWDKKTALAEDFYSQLETDTMPWK